MDQQTIASALTRFEDMALKYGPTVVSSVSNLADAIGGPVPPGPASDNNNGTAMPSHTAARLHTLADILLGILGGIANHAGRARGRRSAESAAMGEHKHQLAAGQQVTPGHRAAPWPRYRCHKVVAALKIGHVDGHKIWPADGEREPINCRPEMFARGKPVVGDYLVEYEDGYRSFSPGKVFEAGYSPMSDCSLKPGTPDFHRAGGKPGWRGHDFT